MDKEILRIVANVVGKIIFFNLLLRNKIMFG